MLTRKMNLIEAKIILNALVFVYYYLFCCHIYLLGSFMEDFSYSVRIRELILMSYFTRYLQRLMKFWQRRKKVESQIMLLNCESRVDLQYPENNV